MWIGVSSFKAISIFVTPRMVAWCSSHCGDLDAGNSCLVLSRVTIDPRSILMVNKRVKLRVGAGNGDLKNARKRLVLFDEIGGVFNKMTLKWRKLDFDVVNLCASTMLQNPATR